MNPIAAELSIRELQIEDLDPLIAYWTQADPVFLTNMGVDLSKMPKESEWRAFLSKQLTQAYNEKESYCLIWLLNSQAVGHSNISKISFGEKAYMHLHLWKPDHRTKGLGIQFVQKCIPVFFKNMELKELYCEPYALNPGPNKLLKKIGFNFVHQYTGIPGWLNFEQEVNLWQLTKENYLNLKENW